ncbi:MAG TPA: glycosyltransferase family 2 protein [Acidimicrobiia bacterium]|nr:glycosyltransferase family 2 protein [Acidimicrobiia bacterium]
MTVEVVLPVLNEVEALPTVLAGLPAAYRAIVVDNGSTDGSAAVAHELGATVVTASPRGFGAACHAGLLAATSDIVCIMDADGSFAGADLPRVVDVVERGAADLALGRRRADRGAWPPHARAGNAILAALLRSRARLPLHDLGPMRAARRADLLELGIVDRRFGYPLEMVLRARRAGWRIVEIDVGYAPRIGRSKVTGTVRGTLRTVRDMTRVARELA